MQDQSGQRIIHFETDVWSLTSGWTISRYDPPGSVQESAYIVAGITTRSPCLVAHRQAASHPTACRGSGPVRTIGSLRGWARVSHLVARSSVRRGCCSASRAGRGKGQAMITAVQVDPKSAGQKSPDVSIQVGRCSPGMLPCRRRSIERAGNGDAGLHQRQLEPKSKRVGITTQGLERWIRVLAPFQTAQ